MIGKVSALLIFCEGPHDVSFVQLLLNKMLNFEKVTWKFSEYPAPFNSLFPEQLKRHAVVDLNLDMAHKFFLPDHVLSKNDWIILLFNSGGRSRSDRVKEFFSVFFPLLDRVAIFPEGATRIVTECRFLFIYDADHKGADQVCQEFYQDFSDNIRERSNLRNSSIFDVHIWPSPKDKGTLEDILIPLFQQSNGELMDKAEKCVDKLFDWDMQAENQERAVAEGARRNKAIITLAGQRKRPGSSMNVVIGQADLISIKDLEKTDVVQIFNRLVEKLAQSNSNGTENRDVHG